MGGGMKRSLSSSSIFQETIAQFKVVLKRSYRILREVLTILLQEALAIGFIFPSASSVGSH